MVVITVYFLLSLLPIFMKDKHSLRAYYGSEYTTKVAKKKATEGMQGGAQRYADMRREAHTVDHPMQGS